MSVESTSKTTSRFARRDSPVRSTARSTPARAAMSAVARVSSVSSSHSGALTCSSSPVTG